MEVKKWGPLIYDLFVSLGPYARYIRNPYLIPASIVRTTGIVGLTPKLGKYLNTFSDVIVGGFSLLDLGRQALIGRVDPVSAIFDIGYLGSRVGFFYNDWLVKKAEKECA